MGKIMNNKHIDLHNCFTNLMSFSNKFYRRYYYGTVVSADVDVDYHFFGNLVDLLGDTKQTVAFAYRSLNG